MRESAHSKKGRFKGRFTDGEVAERLIAPHSKCGMGANPSGVQIPPSPPDFQTFPMVFYVRTRLRRFADGGG